MFRTAPDTCWINNSFCLETIKIFHYEVSETKCGSFTIFHRGQWHRFMFFEYEPSDIRTKVLYIICMYLTVLKTFFYTRNPTNLLFSIYRSSLILPPLCASLSSEKFPASKKIKIFNYIIYFSLFWWLSHVLFKIKRWNHHKFKFDPFSIVATLGTFFQFSALNPNDTFLLATSVHLVLKCLAIECEVSLWNHSGNV